MENNSHDSTKQFLIAFLIDIQCFMQSICTCVSIIFLLVTAIVLSILPSHTNIMVLLSLFSGYCKRFYGNYFLYYISDIVASFLLIMVAADISFLF